MLFVAGCGSPRKTEPLRGPLRAENEAVRRGHQVFMRNCHMCHPNGEGGLGPSINEKPLPAFLLRTQVRQGLGEMPKFPVDKISDAELEDLIAYLVALRHHR
jgi:mono/diheme cytochrome c family protein